MKVVRERYLRQLRERILDRIVDIGGIWQTAFRVGFGALGNWRHLLRFRRVSHLRHHPESARTKLEACS